MTISEVTCGECGEEAGTRFKDIVVQPLSGHWHGFFECCECGHVNSFMVMSDEVLHFLRQNGAQFLPAPKYPRPICGSPSKNLMPLTLREVEEFTWDSGDDELWSFCVSDELKL